MSRLIVITQNLNENDDHRGFFVDWLKEFSTRFDEVSVITLAKGTYAPPPNVRVYSLGKELGVNKFVQVWRFYRLLFRLAPKARAIFAYASPIFVIAAWPAAFLWSNKLVLWYLHRSNTLKLRIALALCNSLVTADVASLTIQSPKIIAVGHGIDVTRFAYPDRIPPVGRPMHILSVGRISSIKNFETLIHATALLRKHIREVVVRIVGRPVMPADFSYERQLRELVTNLDVGGVVHFFGAVPYRDMPEQYQWADIVVGCTPHGGVDKVLLEAMAAGCVVLTSNDVMGKYLIPYDDLLIFRHGQPSDLAAKLSRLPETSTISTAMLESVRKNHELATTIRKISKLL